MKPRLDPGQRPARRGPPAAGAARGIALPAMVFLLVIVGLMLSAAFHVYSQSQQGVILQVQAARALAAARSGSEWGLLTVEDPTGALNLGPSTLPPCFGSTTLSLPTPLSDATVTVSCTRYPATGSTDEGGLKTASFRILAVATMSASGASDYVSRQVEARMTVCKNPGGTAPAYAC